MYPIYVLDFQSHRHLQGHMATSSLLLVETDPTHSNIRNSEYLHAWIEDMIHRRSSESPPHMKVFARTGTQTHASRG